MVRHPLRHWVTEFGVLASHPIAFTVVGGYSVLWLIFQRDTFDFHGVATMAVWFMTLFIQRATHRDTQAIHAKLDELLRADKGARTELAQLDEKDPEEIERHRDQAKTQS